jgi:tRNA(Ile)-lysidine synthase
MFVAKVKKTIQKHAMLQPKDRVIVGVSGGPDSVALLYVLYQLRRSYDMKLQVAHLNHGLRGKEASRDVRFVENLANELGLPCVVEACDVPSYKKHYSLSSQEAAREVRYQFLEEVQKRTGASKIALGHNANDQAETLMMWLLRGAGLKGLGGMPPVRNGVIIRPLIETTRKEIAAFLDKKDIPFVVDSSNRKNDYLRNRIRHEIIPLLEGHYNPQIVKKLVNTANILALENEYLEDNIKKILDVIIVARKNTSLTIGINELLALPLALQLRCLRAVVEQVKGDLKRITSIHLFDSLRIAASREPHKVLKLPDGIRIERSYLRLKITANQSETLPFNYRYSVIPDRVRLQEIEKEMVFNLLGKRKVVLETINANIAYLDADKVLMPLVIRNAKPGDSFQPFGMRGEKKIKNFFSDEKVELNQRKRVPLVFCGGLLAWVGGMRIHHALRVTNSTKRILKIELYKREKYQHGG